MPIIFYLLAMLQVLDVISTVVALRNPKLHEANGVLKALMVKIGVLPTLLLVKGLFIGLLILYWHQVPVEVLYGLTALYCWVVYNNFKLIRGG